MGYAPAAPIDQRAVSIRLRVWRVCIGGTTPADKPLKQAVIAPSALSLPYPPQGVEGYPRERFLEDLIGEAERDIRSCFDAGAATVQMDFTEGRLAVKLDPSKGLLREFVRINNLLLSRFEEPLRMRIGIHTCPGGDRDATHSADVDYAELSWCVTVCCRRPGTSRWIGWELPTIAASRSSATTCPPRATSRSPRSAPESRGSTSLNRCWRLRADAP